MSFAEISVHDAAALLRDAPDDTVLLDVREHPELETAAIEAARHIPMGEVPARLAEIDRDKTVLCLCHLGGRSAQVADFLAAQGFADVRNVTGGIEAWARDVDPGIVR
jgi:adenylyltransferase/sulfurtransferase